MSGTLVVSRPNRGGPQLDRPFRSEFGTLGGFTGKRRHFSSPRISLSILLSPILRGSVPGDTFSDRCRLSDDREPDILPSAEAERIRRGLATPAPSGEAPVLPSHGRGSARNTKCSMLVRQGSELMIWRRRMTVGRVCDLRLLARRRSGFLGRGDADVVVPGEQSAAGPSLE